MDGKGQVAGRIAAVLSAIDRCGGAGARLVDLARETGIARPSIHRLLQELAAVDYVRMIAQRRYGLGPALYGLGLSAPPPVWNLAAIEGLLGELALATGDTVYLGLRQRASVRYLLRLDGGYPVRAQIVEVGQIVPIGATFGGIALLASSGDAEIERALTRKSSGETASESAEQDQRAKIRAVLEQCRQFREAGYLYSRDLVWPGVSGLATAVANPSGKPLLSVSISAVNDRLPPGRALELAPLLLDVAGRVAAQAS